MPFILTPTPTPTPSTMPVIVTPSPTLTPSPIPTPSSTPLGSNDALTAALVGAAVTAIVTLLIFIVDRVIRSSAAFRETRREVVAEYFDAMTKFVIAATAPRPPAQGFAPQAAALISARSKLVLALGTRHRSIGVWLVGMEAAMTSAAQIEWKSPAELKAKAEILQARLTEVLNALTRLQEGRLFVADFTAPGGVMMLSQQSATWARKNAARIEWAYQVQNAGRFNALVAWALWVLHRIAEWFKSWPQPASYKKAPDGSGS